MQDLSPVAQSLVSRFDRMVRRDGGKIRLIDASEDLIRVGYRPGTDTECKEGVCIMPEAELHAMMSEVLAAQAPNARLQVMRDTE
jgi:Fe-S cluster biogenesis protein NfuA